MLTWVEVDTDAIARNIEAFRTILPPATSVMAVVKANAYGHGLQVVAPVAAAHAEWLGVNNIEEALAVRQLGIRKPVAILGHTPIEQSETVVGEEFRQAVYRLDVAQQLSNAAARKGTTAYLHLKVETGTNRQGIALNELRQFIGQLLALPNLNIEGLYTHFANIEDTLDPSFALKQLERFRQATAILADAGVHPAQIHAAASAGALLYPETGFTMVRLGIGAYGIWPSRETQLAARERGRQIALAPALSWKTRVVQVKTVEPGEYVGYG